MIKNKLSIIEDEIYENILFGEIHNFQLDLLKQEMVIKIIKMVTDFHLKFYKLEIKGIKKFKKLFPTSYLSCAEITDFDIFKLENELYEVFIEILDEPLNILCKEALLTLEKEEKFSSNDRIIEY